MRSQVAHKQTFIMQINNKSDCLCVFAIYLEFRIHHEVTP